MKIEDVHNAIPDENPEHGSNTEEEMDGVYSEDEADD